MRDGWTTIDTNHRAQRWRFSDRVRSVGVTVATTRKIISWLKIILDYAISRDLIAARDVKVIGRRDEGSKKIVLPSESDVRRLIDAAPYEFGIKLSFACASGLRAGEMHALRWHHIDLKTSKVGVETRVDRYGEEDVPKTDAGIRRIPLGDELVHMLKEWKMRTKFAKSDDLVFPNARGSYINHYNMINRHYNPLFEKANVPRFNWHTLRHFAISTWIEAGFPPKAVQTFAGHSTLQVTMDRYGHLFPADDHSARMNQIASELFKKR